MVEGLVAVSEQVAIIFVAETEVSAGSSVQCCDTLGVGLIASSLLVFTLLRGHNSQFDKLMPILRDKGKKKGNDATQQRSPITD